VKLNTLKTTFLMALMTVLLVTAGAASGGQQGMILAFIFALLMNGISYWYSDRIVLRMYGAKELRPEAAPKLYRTVEELALRAGMPMPKLYIVPSAAPNAFDTGRNEKHAAVAVTEGILRILDERELRGVLAHELSRVPQSLANALKKLQLGAQRIPMQTNPATAHMFIVNPLAGGGLLRLFSTHPPIQERIRSLERMAAKQGLKVG